MCVVHVVSCSKSRCLPMALCVCRCRASVTSRSMSRTTRQIAVPAARYAAVSIPSPIRSRGKELDIDGQYVLSPKDLCTVDFLDTFIEAGVRVLKIEGRARGGEYVKRVVESYDEAIKLLERGEYTPETVAPIKEKLRTVFNRDFWGGYYAAKTMVEHSQHYGSSATLKKVYMGKVTNYFKRIGVAEVLVEACEVMEGDDLLFMGEKTGVVEQKALGIMLNEKPADSAKQGDYISLKTEQEVRRGDKVYKEVER